MTTIPFMTPPQAAKELNVHEETIRRAIASGQLKAQRVGKTWAIRSNDLKEYDELRHAAKDKKQSRKRAVPDHLLTVTEAAQQSRVNYQVLLKAVGLGHLPFCRYGRDIGIARSDLDAYVQLRNYGASCLGVKAAAKKLGLHYNTIYNSIQSGNLAARKIGKEHRIDPKDLDRYALWRKKKSSSPDLFEETEKRDG